MRLTNERTTEDGALVLTEAQVEEMTDCPGAGWTTDASDLGLAPDEVPRALVIGGVEVPLLGRSECRSLIYARAYPTPQMVVVVND